MVGSRITKRMVDNLKVTAAEYVAWDGDIPGFGVRVRPSGSKSYIVQYRAGAGRKAPTRKLTLGAVGKLAPDEARNLARKAVGSIAHGLDPAESRADDRRGLTVGEVAGVFLERPCPCATEVRQPITGILKRIVIPALGTTKANRVKRACAWERASNLASPRPRTTRYRWFPALRIAAPSRTSSSVRPRQASPEMEADALSGESDRGGCRQHVQLCRQSRAGGGGAQPGARDREIPRKWTRAVPFDRRTVIGPHAAAAIRLLLFTGCRLREILHLKWDYVDFERGLLFLQKARRARKRWCSTPRPSP
jgi:hypothetical protein